MHLVYGKSTSMPTTSSNEDHNSSSADDESDEDDDFFVPKGEGNKVCSWTTSSYLTVTAACFFQKAE